MSVSALACEKPRKRSDIKQVTLAPKKEALNFYYHVNGYVVFIPSDWLIEQMKKSLETQKAEGTNDGALASLLSLVIQDIPLKQNVDLYKYSFEDSYYLMRIIRIVHYAIE